METKNKYHPKCSVEKVIPSEAQPSRGIYLKRFLRFASLRDAAVEMTAGLFDKAQSPVTRGSALILAVVLTSLLAVIGMVFLLSSRVDSLATSGLSDQKDLNSAVETVVSKISQVLSDDIPRSDPNGTKLSEYFDYPGDNDKWLACLEPDLSGRRKWRQISDVYNRFDSRDHELLFRVPESIIAEYQEAEAVEPNEQADADGDGVADSRWVKVDDMTSSKGKEIYAAIRIIDNCAMLNVNTAYKFDPNDPAVTESDIDGTSQLQVNLIGLSGRKDANTYVPSEVTDLLEARANYGIGLNPQDLDKYAENVIWQYGEPNGPYTPFDISDELELRYRFLLNQEDVDTRLEPWGGEFRNSTAETPIDNNSTMQQWYERAYDNGSLNQRYAYRHIATTYNMDRIIAPDGKSMVNINDANVNNVNTVYETIKKSLADSNVVVGLEETAAHIAVNLIDYQDSDSNVTAFTNPDDGKTYYGFETPCIYISELVALYIPYTFKDRTGSFVKTSYNSFGIELYMPDVDVNDLPDPNEWKLRIEGFRGEIFPVNWSDTAQYHLITFENPNAPLPIDSGFTGVTERTELPRYGERIFNVGKSISLCRQVQTSSGIKLVMVDSKTVPSTADVGGGWLTPDSDAHSLRRDINLHKCIKRLWAPSASLQTTLGVYNNYTYSSDEGLVQAYPASEPFKNVGEIGMLFRKGAYFDSDADRDTRVGYGTNKNEEQVRLNLQDPDYQNLFQHLTVFDPAVYSWNDPNETRIKGRININTAPWYVLAQLPWVSQQLAQAIVAYRDKLNSPVNYSGRTGSEGFGSIGELMRVNEMGYYDQNDPGNPANELNDFPDLTYSDGAPDDFEERDVIFARISNLVTVRSDVFTAYILVRIGKDGPQKRVIAILDRSNVYKPGGKVKIVALQQVPDPR